ncbi:hypothetical protein GCM10011609_88290 [Lentzea pudingi]|uniref:MFS transporter, AGZA family, xanthine/uracil permease n=1 Tax=Lentzea pudingi TaxID=1789439 RepID=A0ABQ2IUW4_9PSEU|nr:hypothetical protein GCM10011609_88290 [Lentzea pudingi]
MGRILMVDGAARSPVASRGSAPNTVFLESAASVGEGARTGLASVVTGGLFLVALLFTPLATVVPAQAAAPALVVIGGLMMTQIRRTPWQDTDFTIPVFLTVSIIPFTYSITNGIGAGLVSYVVLRICKGRWPGWLMTGLALLFAVYFGVDLISGT